MLYADVIRGTAERTGPFSGTSSNESVYPSLGGVDEVEENGNTYRIYRRWIIPTRRSFQAER